MRRIAFALDLDRGAGLLDLIEIVSREFDVSGFEILFQTAELGRSRYGDDPGLLRQQPGKRDLRRRRLLALADLFRRSTSAWLAFIASGVKRGRMLRKSSSGSLVFSFIAPVRKPFPSGL